MLVLAVTACGQSARGSASSDPRGSASSAGSSGVAPASPAPADRLEAALGPLRAAAAFDTLVEVDGVSIVSASGRSVGADSDVTVTTSGRTVEYVRLPPQAWAREASRTWVLLAPDAAPAAPLDVLSRPLTLVGEAGLPGGSSFRATYPAAALGLAGDPVAVTIEVTGATVTFRYEASASGRRTSSVTTLRPGSSDPIVSPVPASSD